jgi:hypothetical protein
MRVVVEYEMSQRRGGLQATSQQLRLTGHGTGEEEALANLRRAAAAWVLGLTLANRLDDALRRHGIRCDEHEMAGLVIDLRGT